MAHGMLFTMPYALYPPRREHPITGGLCFTKRGCWSKVICPESHTDEKAELQGNRRKTRKEIWERAEPGLD